MGYSEQLKKLFKGISLSAEDLLLLESFQINYLPDRVPKKEFSALIRKYPFVRNFLILRKPSIESFINSVLNEYNELENETLIKEYCNEVLWEIADLIVYNKFPEVYDANVDFRWDIKEIISEKKLKDKTVTDVGAGSGMLAFLLAKFAKTVFAIEPIGSFRTYMREKALKEECRNLFTIDGYLHSIPLPDNSIDILFTSNAIGWNLEDELKEIERVVKPAGQVIHLMRTPKNELENPTHDRLISPDWQYNCIQQKDKTGLKIKYIKTIM